MSYRYVIYILCQFVILCLPLTGRKRRDRIVEFRVMFVFFKSSNQFFSSTFFFFLFIKFKGYNAKEAGKRKCEMCLAGTYASMQNTVHCLLCEGGKLSKEASTSCELLCKAGQYKMVIKIDYFDTTGNQFRLACFSCIDQI